MAEHSPEIVRMVEEMQAEVVSAAQAYLELALVDEGEREPMTQDERDYFESGVWAGHLATLEALVRRGWVTTDRSQPGG